MEEGRKEEEMKKTEISMEEGRRWRWYDG